MWNFIAVIDELDIDVFEGPGQELLGLSEEKYDIANRPNTYAKDIMVCIEDDRWDDTFVTEFCNNVAFSRKASSFCQCKAKVKLNLEGLTLMAPKLEGKVVDAPTTSEGYVIANDKFQ